LHKRQSEKLRQVIDSLTSSGIKVEPVATTRPHEASVLAEKAVSSRPDLIIACGGDGTINEVICGMAGSQIPLLVIPAGTANVLAKEIGLAHDWMKSVDLIKTGVVRRISLGRVNQRHFILMAGIGVDAEIIAALNPGLKRKLGEGSFWIAGFKQLLRYHFTPFQLAINRVSYSATFAVISKARNYGGPFQITAQADLFSDEFDICLFQGRSRWRYLHYLWHVAMGRHRSLPDVRYLKAKTVEALGDSNIRVQVDGELAGTLPQTFSVEPDALSLMVPR
jgi:YegS/Rv2252/BmrU family lipid kinase